MSKNLIHAFFVYGTLLPKQPNFSLWKSDISHMMPATLNGGLLYDMGYYPMLVAAKESHLVHGMVMTVHSDKYALVLQRLDGLEGYDPNQPNQTGYRRRLVKVVLQNGRFQPAWAYLGQSALVTNKQMIESGDWATYAAQTQPKLHEWWKTIDTVANLHEKGK
ncbi:MAG: hypothetical protein DHS20C20_28650 [Ardenticatenaceae bacterium]|nr:MAG: hypothetical protein DHS20C20_28650 [Ardenticatenaceae bacterium]